MLVLKLYTGSGEQPVLREHVFSTPHEAVPAAAVLRKTAEAFRVEVKTARAARLAVLDDPSCTSVMAKLTALIADAVSLPHVDLLGRISVFVMGPVDQWTLYCSPAAPSRCCPALQQRCCSPRWRSWRTGWHASRRSVKTASACDLKSLEYDCTAVLLPVNVDTCSAQWKVQGGSPEGTLAWVRQKGCFGADDMHWHTQKLQVHALACSQSQNQIRQLRSLIIIIN